MRAVVLDGPGAVSVQDVPDAGLLGADSAVVRVDATAICGSDLHLYHGQGGAPGTRLGHEFVGTVEEVGPGVRTVSRGDRVLVSGVIGCGRCPDCLARDPGVCRNNGLAVFGTGTALPGGQAEAVDASAGDTVGRVQELTGGRGAESVIEAVGADQTVSDAIMCAAPGGTVSVVGVNLGMAFPFPMALALMRRLTFRVTLASIPGTWDSLVPLIASGRLHPEDVFTHRLPLSAAADAYRIFDSRTDGVLKVLLDPAG
ncbi:MAG TPA: alcohol dehydrogenase catalytic domain-containing protein [Acidimicrobiales bacterium]|nr:alcohol dehydrogenase catalytic domain-containing protein [Acidimicrobiales bacterium]